MMRHNGNNRNPVALCLNFWKIRRQISISHAVIKGRPDQVIFCCSKRIMCTRCIA